MARPAPAASRAIQILDLLVTHPTERFTLTELVRRTGMSLGSAHATLAVLEGSGHVSRNATTRAYSLGPALVVAGVVALEHHPAIDAARQVIEPLATQLGIEVVVSARPVNEIIFVARSGQHSAFGPGVREGERVPLVPPLGAVFLAWSDEREIKQWLSRSPDSPSAAIARYEASLDLARTRGFAVTAGSDTQRQLGERTYSLSDSPSNTELRNDVTEGREVKSMREADRVFALTRQHVNQMKGQFPLPMSHDEMQMPAMANMDAPPEVVGQLNGFVAPYLALSQSLADDDLDAAKQAVEPLHQRLASLAPIVSESKAVGMWSKEKRDLSEIIARLQKANDLSALRSGFALLSEQMLSLQRMFGLPTDETLYELHCPMAFKGRGASWLQSDDAVRNPYYGASMLKCADKVEKL